MPLDPQIPLAVQVPAPAAGPQNIGQLMQARGLASEIALRNAQAQRQTADTADIQAQAQQRNRDLADENTVQAAQKDPAQATAFGTGDFSSLAGKIQPKTLQTLATNRAAMVEKQTTNDVATLGEAETKHKRIEESITGLKQLADTAGDPQAGFAAVQSAYPEAVANLVKDKIVEPGTLPDHITSLDDLDRIATVNNVMRGVNAEALKNKQSKADVAAKGTEATKNTAQANQAQAEADLNTFQLNLRKNFNPATLEQGVNDLFPQDPKFGPAKNAALAAGKLAIAAGGKPEDANAAVQKVYQEQVQPFLSTTIAGKASQAKADAQATGPVHLAESIAQAKAMREGDNPAIAGVPPAVAGAATSAATKLDLDYAKAKASADSIKTVLDLAAAGNKAAGVNAPLVGVGAVNAVNGIKRINSAEIAQYGTAGSLLDKIQGKLQGWTEGQPIPKDVLDDMQTLHQALHGSSYQQYLDGLHSVNARYGSKFGPTAPNPLDSEPKGGSSALQVTDPRGTVHTFKTKQDADAFRAAAGIK